MPKHVFINRGINGCLRYSAKCRALIYVTSFLDLSDTSTTSSRFHPTKVWDYIPYFSTVQATDSLSFHTKSPVYLVTLHILHTVQISGINAHACISYSGNTLSCPIACPNAETVSQPCYDLRFLTSLSVATSLLFVELGKTSPEKSDCRSVVLLDSQWANNSFPGAGTIGAGFLLKAFKISSKNVPDSQIHKERTNFLDWETECKRSIICFQ